MDEPGAEVGPRKRAVEIPPTTEQGAVATWPIPEESTSRARCKRRLMLLVNSLKRDCLESAAVRFHRLFSLVVSRLACLGQGCSGLWVAC
jgi:hypothetical protein